MLDEISQAWLDAALTNDDAEADRLAALLDVVGQLEHTRDTDLPAAALRYAARGTRVFPCQPRGKTPLTLNGFHAATIDPEQITAWWTRWPDANIGLPTGHQFDVIDLDGPDAAILWAKGKFDDFKPFIGHSLTARQAGHHLLVKPTGRGNAAALQPNVDFRGQGGYIVAPPSVGANGRRYTWLHPLNFDEAL